MENLATLPPKNDTIKTPEEEAIMKQLFPNPPQPHPVQPSPPSSTGSHPSMGNASPSGNNSSSKPPSTIKWKLVGVTILLFILLANPWVDALFTKVPYCGEGGMTVLGVKALLFAILFVLASYYI